MSNQKILIGTIISTVFLFVLDYLWYAILMKDYFGTSPNERVTPLFPFLILGLLVFSYAFCRIYTKGYEESKTTTSQGINYGILVTLLVFVPMAFIRYSVYDGNPMSHYLIDLVFRLVQLVILGLIIAKYFGAIATKPGSSSGGGA